MKSQTPPKWTQIYPQGTQAGDEEQRFFIAIARNPKFKYRSVAAIAKEARLSKERTEEIIEKYFKKGMIFQSNTNEDGWAYWERVPGRLKKDDTIAEKDKKSRLTKK